MIWTTGVGQHQMWAMQYLRCDEPRSFITSGGLGTMGYGLPAAVGAKAARPDATVVCVDGDGCFQMTCQELATSVTEELPIVVVIVNNGYLGMVRQWQDMFFEERFSQVRLAQGSPDYVKLAEAYGAVGLRSESEDELEDALATALDLRPHRRRRLPRRSRGALLPDDPRGRRRPRPRRVRRARGGAGDVIHTLSVLVEDKPGALMRISSMFARRGYNIDSLAVGPTERANVSRIVLRVDCSQHSLEQIEKQMHKLVNVLRVSELEPGQAVERELALITVTAPPTRRAELLSLAEVFGGPRRRRRAGRDRLRSGRNVGGGRAVRGARPSARHQGARPHRTDRPRPRLDRPQQPERQARPQRLDRKDLAHMATIHSHRQRRVCSPARSPCSASAARGTRTR